ncbi:MAG: energy-coupling factor transporter transmembrane component T family protein [Christensenellales bacterium]|jgi:energy-coupling factor transport system permease protein
MERLQSDNPLYPLVCIFSAVIILAAGLLNAKHPLFPAYILAVLLLYYAFGFWNAALKCLLIFIPVGAAFAFFSFLFQRDAEIAAQMAGRVILIGVSALPMITLPPINLTRCLSGLGFPRILTLGMLIAIRFVPVIADEVKRVREAMRTRGVKGSFYRAFIIPVIIRLMNISDTMALSLETRAFSTGTEPVSVYKQVRFLLRDGVYCAAVSALLATWLVLI